MKLLDVPSGNFQRSTNLRIEARKRIIPLRARHFDSKIGYTIKTRGLLTECRIPAHSNVGDERRNDAGNIRLPGNTTLEQALLIDPRKIGHVTATVMVTVYG